MKVTQLKGGSLSSTSLYEDGDRKFIRKSISTKDNREYGYVRWYTQLKKLQRLAETGLFPKVLDVNYSNNSAYFDIDYLEGYRDVKTILAEDTLTENQIETVPKSIGDCHYLQKVAFAGNTIKELPVEMSNCKHLELLRISANNLQSIPSWLLSLPKLSWLAFSGNPCSIKDQKKNEYKEFHWNSFELKEQLGEGASGIISKANLKSVSESEVAIKVFKGKLTSDGFSEDELHTSMMVGDHENIIPIIGKITEHPEGKEGLIMELISTDYQNLGNPPSFETCTRDIFPAHVFYSLNQVLTIFWKGR